MRLISSLKAKCSKARDALLCAEGASASPKAKRLSPTLAKQHSQERQLTPLLGVACFARRRRTLMLLKARDHVGLLRLRRMKANEGDTSADAPKVREMHKRRRREMPKVRRISLLRQRRRETEIRCESSPSAVHERYGASAFGAEMRRHTR